MKRKLLFAATLLAGVLGGGSTAFAQSLDELKAKIDGIESKLGFEAGEYAPYDVYDALAEAKAADTDDAISAALQKLNALQANTEEVNAIWDGLFNHDYSGLTGNINPLGWFTDSNMTEDGYNVRYVTGGTDGNNPGLAYISSKSGLMTKRNAYYGYAEKYSMPLKANTYYTIKFSVGGWGQKAGNHNITIVDPDKKETKLNEFEVIDNNANNNSASWKDIEVTFKTSSAGNYVLGLVNLAGGENQTVYSNFQLLKTEISEGFAELHNTIEKIESNLGFGAGQYAPYNVYDVLTEAKGVAPTDEEAIDEACDKLGELETNGTEVNAIFDGSFEEGDYTAATSTNHVQPLGWYTNKNNGVVPNDLRFASTPQTGNNDGLSATSSGNGMMAKFDAYYGNDGKYAMPLEADTYYTVTFITGGWGENHAGHNVNIVDPSGNERTVAVLDKSKTADANANKDNWSEIIVSFKTGEAGNYKFGLKSLRDGGQNQTVYGDFKLYKSTPVAVEISQGKYGTLIVPFDAETPENATVYSVTGVDEDNVLTLEEAEEGIKANVPCIILADGGNVSDQLLGEGLAYLDKTYTEGLLTGVYAEVNVPADSYVLQTQGGVQAFYVVKGEFTAKPNRAYLTVADGNVKAFYFGTNGDATAIKGVEATAGAENAVIYNLAGQRVVNPTKGGIYIVNGQKVLVK